MPLVQDWGTVSLKIDDNVVHKALAYRKVPSVVEAIIPVNFLLKFVLLLAIVIFHSYHSALSSYPPVREEVHLQRYNSPAD